MSFHRRALLAAAASLAAGPAFAQAVPTGAPDDPRPRFYALINRPAPDFAFPKRGGGQASLGDYRGKVLIVAFGGLWCPDCIRDGANVNALSHMADRDPNVEFLYIHTRDRFGRWGSIDAYFAENHYDYPVAFDPSRAFARDTYRIEWSPSYLIIDRAGVIRAWRTDLETNGAHDFFVQAQTIAQAR